MSISRQIQSNSFVSLLRVNGDEVVFLSGALKGQKFTARFDAVEVINTETELGSDVRMQDVVRFQSDPGIKKGDIFSGIGQKWRVLKRENNAASPTADYWVDQQI